MKEGDIVKSKRCKEKLLGVIKCDDGVYSSWGECHFKVLWNNGKVEYYPVKMLEVVIEGR